MSRIVGLVLARGASQGVPRKNLKCLAGAPLLQWTLAPAREACDLVVLSSEDPEIRALGLSFAVSVHEEPPMLASGRVGDLPVARDALREVALNPSDVVILLRPTAPFRRPEEIRDVAALLRYYQADSVRSVVPAAEHPQKVYLEAGYALGREGRARLPLLEPATGPRHRANHPRQWLAPAWRACGFIDAVRADVLLGLESLEGDRILGWPAPEGRARIELDEEWQFRWAEALAQDKGWKPGEIG